MVDILGFNTVPSNLRLLEVYGDYIHQNYGTHVYDGIADNIVWKRW